MSRFIQGVDRTQQTLFAGCLDDHVADDNPARVVDAYVELLDLRDFGGAQPARTGRPGYHPSTLLKIYLYGYLNRIQSSRRLEREALRNVELMWLTGRLAPDFKTIADFRRDNGLAIRAACARFILICRELGLFAHAVAAIDGSKFKGVNARERNFTKGKLKRRVEQVEESINRYLNALDAADLQEGDVSQAKAMRLKEKIASMKQQLQRLHHLQADVLAAPDQQISLTDPDARAMATSMRGSGVVGYNVQAAVDTTHHLIVTHEVTNGAIPFVPKPYTSESRKAGRFAKDDFTFNPRENTYSCPAGETLTYRFSTTENDMKLNGYWTTKCSACPLKARCTTGEMRYIKRWEHEGVVDAMLKRLASAPDSMNVRRRTVEHPFGTLKSWMGATHFLTKGLDNVATEMSLNVLAYNLKRIMAIISVKPLIERLAE